MTQPTVTLSAATDNSLAYTVNNPDGAGVTITLELNRASDFSSDDSLYVTLAGAAAGNNAMTVYGLPSGTPWWARAITSAGASTYSTSIVAATSAVALTTTYAGFSIDKALLVVPESAYSHAVTTGAAVAGNPINNISLDSPNAVARLTPAGGSAAFSFLTSGMPIDTIALLGTLLNDAATWRVQCFSDAVGGTSVYDSGTVQFRCSPTLGRRPFYHGMIQLPSAVSARFWQITISSAAPVIIIRHLVAGLARQSLNPSRGWTQKPNDLGTAQRTRFGDVDHVAGWRGKLVDFEMSWLREAEYQTKWADLLQLVGTTRHVFVIPNGKRNTWMNDRIGFGFVSDMEGQNVQSSRFAQSLSVNSCY